MGGTHAPLAAWAQEPACVRPVEPAASAGWRRRGRSGLATVLAVLAAGAALCLVLLVAEPGERAAGPPSASTPGRPAALLSQMLFTQLPIPDAFDVRWG